MLANKLRFCFTSAIIGVESHRMNSSPSPSFLKLQVSNTCVILRPRQRMNYEAAVTKLHTGTLCPCKSNLWVHRSHVVYPYEIYEIRVESIVKASPGVLGTVCKNISSFSLLPLLCELPAQISYYRTPTFSPPGLFFSSCCLLFQACFTSPNSAFSSASFGLNHVRKNPKCHSWRSSYQEQDLPPILASEIS